MPRVFLPFDDLPKTLTISGDKARYLSSVLRCVSGDSLFIYNGKGTGLRAVITSITRREVSVMVLGTVQCRTESPLELILLQGMLKAERMDFVVQKTTELGIKEIVPIVAERSEVRDTRKVSRWRKIAEEAARQSGRTAAPVIREPVSLNAFLLTPHPFVQQRDSARGILFWEAGGISVSVAAGKCTGAPSVFVAVGPEGGFTEAEVHAAQAGGFVIASLGRRILRAETAALAATALLQYALGDLNVSAEES